MPFSKEKSRKTNSQGRSKKDPEDTLAGKSEEEQKTYYRHGMRKSRGDDPVTPQKEVEGSSEDESEPTSSRRVGRPPIREAAFSPASYLKRRCSTMRDNYRKKKVTKIRSAAIGKRWQMRLNFAGNENPSEEEDSNPSGSSEAEPMLSSSEDEDSTPSTVADRQERRYKVKLQSLLSNNSLVNLDLFIHFSRSKSSPFTFSTNEYVLMGNMSERQLRYRGDAILDFLRGINSDSVDKLLIFWLDMLLQNKIIAATFQTHGWDTPEQYTPLHYKVSQAASSLQTRYLKRDQTTNEQRILGTKYVAEVIKVSGLSTNTIGGAQLLATHTNCSRKFATAVLQAVESGDLDNFIGRKTRCDSIHADRFWVNRITEFVFKPENARAVPGQESVSIKYGVRRPKFILRKPRAVISSEFLAENPACPFKASTIMREFPQNAVTASEKDKRRNVCPYHSNARRIVSALHNNDVAMDIPSSVRGMCMTHMCEDESVEEVDPVTWNRECATGRCKHCPTPQITIPTEKATKVISFSLWEYGVDEVKKKKQEAKLREKELREAEVAEEGSKEENNEKEGKKKSKEKADGRVFGLFRHAASVQETADMLLAILTKLKSHTYNAYCQWNAHTQNRSALDEASIITIEDYQQNLEIEYNEMPTSMAFSSNKTTVALYPCVVEYKVDDVLHKGAIVFLSDDKIHDMQQVSAFEMRMFEILRAKIPHDVTNWQRWSDGAGHEFRSQFCNAELMRLKNELGLTQASFEYFEAHEGKNVSDALGSIIKNKVKRILADHMDGIRSSEELVSLLSVMPDQTAKFTFIVVENFKEIARIPAKERASLAFPGIMKTHSIKIVNNGLLANEQTCTTCTPSEMCAICNNLPATVTSNTSVIDADDVEQDGTERVDDDENASDEESDIEYDHNATDDTNYGYPIWAKYGQKWYPAKVVSPDVIPAVLQKKLKSVEGFIPVEWYGEGKYGLVKKRNTDTLSQNRKDESRAAVSEDMLIKYNLALSDLHND